MIVIVLELLVKNFRMLHEDELNDAVLWSSNKQDLPKAMGVGEIVKELGLTEYPNRVWYVQPSTANW